MGGQEKEIKYKSYEWLSSVPEERQRQRDKEREEGERKKRGGRERERGRERVGKWRGRQGVRRGLAKLYSAV